MAFQCDHTKHNCYCCQITANMFYCTCFCCHEAKLYLNELGEIVDTVIVSEGTDAVHTYPFKIKQP